MDEIQRRVAAVVEPEAALALEEEPPDPVVWAEQVSGERLDAWQREIMRSQDSHLLINCARQVGKSYVIALRSAYRARWLRKVAVVISPTQRQSRIIYSRTKAWLSREEGAILRATATEMELATGGRLAALPGDRPDLSIRGDTIDDLVVDEASRVKDSLIVAATPSTATKPEATITYLSTPAGPQGAFHAAWTRESWWTKIQVTAEQCSRISAEFLARERRRLGPLYDQEYLCRFIAAPGGLFLSEDLARLFDPGRAEVFSEVVSVPERPVVW
jgi:hypothetical protein